MQARGAPLDHRHQPPAPLPGGGSRVGLGGPPSGSAGSSRARTDGPRDGPGARSELRVRDDHRPRRAGSGGGPAGGGARHGSAGVHPAVPGPSPGGGAAWPALGVGGAAADGAVLRHRPAGAATDRLGSAGAAAGLAGRRAAALRGAPGHPALGTAGTGAAPGHGIAGPGGPVGGGWVLAAAEPRHVLARAGPAAARLADRHPPDRLRLLRRARPRPSPGAGGRSVPAVRPGTGGVHGSAPPPSMPPGTFTWTACRQPEWWAGGRCC